jgi:hypothetical protein
MSIRLELTKAFIAAGAPIGEIPSKVRALENFCEAAAGGEVESFASSDDPEVVAEQEQEMALRRAAETHWGTSPGSPLTASDPVIPLGSDTRGGVNAFMANDPDAGLATFVQGDPPGPVVPGGN